MGMQNYVNECVCLLLLFYTSYLLATRAPQRHGYGVHVSDTWMHAAVDDVYEMAGRWLDMPHFVERAGRLLGGFLEVLEGGARYSRRSPG